MNRLPRLYTALLSAALVLSIAQLRAQSIRVEYVRPAAPTNADPSAIIFQDDFSHAPTAPSPLSRVRPG